MKWRKRATGLLVAGTLVSGLAFAQERLSTPEYRAVCDALICQCGCYSTISHCAMENCHSAEPIREEIASRLNAGESPESIIEVFKERYGLAILSAPPASGFHLTAWITPFLALLVGLFVTWLVLRSWRRQTAPASDAPVEMATLTDAQRARIERELRDLSS